LTAPQSSPLEFERPTLPLSENVPDFPDMETPIPRLLDWPTS
jgi:hypothetical protein